MKKVVSFFGILVFLASISLSYQLWHGASNAVALNDQKTIHAALSEDTPPFCIWQVVFDEPILAEDRSKAIVINATNPNDQECQTALSLRAPSFILSPAKDEQQLKLPPKGTGSISWIITPNKTGTFEIAVSDILNTKIFGITVTNMFGLSAIQAKIFSAIGTLFGPMLTLPWWYDRMRQRKAKSAEQQKEIKESEKET